MTALILINPHAAGGRAQRLVSPVQAWCRALPPENDPPQIVVPESIDKALEVLAQLPAQTRVVIVGGDGTLNQMLPGLVQGAHSVGLVPYGSGNDCARAWGLHRMTWQQALAYALEGPNSAIDMGRVVLDQNASFYFHSSLAVGFDASVGNRALVGPQFLRGLPRYLLATLRELVNLKNWPLKVEVDGHLVCEGQSLLASSLNTPSYGGGMPAVPHATLDDGQLNLLIGGKFNRLQTLLMLPLLLIGKHLGHPRIQCHAFSSATLHCATLVPVAADGETLGFANRMDVECLPKSLQVVKL
ncbi:MAG: diacylglycerol kinase family protein [Burkholderiales bacterium]|nr:diacylglycerol kinase family protein [Burkholderiales bacterium]